ncbi:hypothetical protein DRE_01892 [Drechslerella stenobrocha 248]|uniref:Uncharacterized protein n=1 Tax=Drechslerella stenobrocha 248 TaxID=1043628 RepID=W7IHF0_9PEZI|nr:hypothetical protein DRE_01892 [Drechslerella stenobrocha 248]
MAMDGSTLAKKFSSITFEGKKHVPSLPGQEILLRLRFRDKVELAFPSPATTKMVQFTMKPQSITIYYTESINVMVLLINDKNGTYGYPRLYCCNRIGKRIWESVRDDFAINRVTETLLGTKMFAKNHVLALKGDAEESEPGIKAIRKHLGHSKWQNVGLAAHEKTCRELMQASGLDFDDFFPIIKGNKPHRPQAPQAPATARAPISKPTPAPELALASKPVPVSKPASATKPALAIKPVPAPKPTPPLKPAAASALKSMGQLFVPIRYRPLTIAHLVDLRELNPHRGARGCPKVADGGEITTTVGYKGSPKTARTGPRAQNTSTNNQYWPTQELDGVGHTIGYHVGKGSLTEHAPSWVAQVDGGGPLAKSSIGRHKPEKVPTIKFATGAIAPKLAPKIQGATEPVDTVGPRPASNNSYGGATLVPAPPRLVIAPGAVRCLFLSGNNSPSQRGAPETSGFLLANKKLETVRDSKLGASTGVQRKQPRGHPGLWDDFENWNSAATGDHYI